MSLVSEAIHNHHQQILDTLSGHLAAILAGSPAADPAGLADFLKSDLLPHAVGEERYLYPAVEPLLKSYGSATATMTVDHEFLKRYVEQIEAAAADLKRASGTERGAKEVELQRLTLQLDALLRVHLEKEERIYIPLFERYLPAAEQQRILDGMHEAYDGDQPGTTVQELDVREIAPRQRHELIFDRFAALQPGEAFLLVNDHDPKPLRYQLQAEHPGTFSWEYVEQGPDVWRVAIARSAAG